MLLEFKMLLPPVKNKRPWEIQVHKHWTKVYSQKGLTAMGGGGGEGEGGIGWFMVYDYNCRSTKLGETDDKPCLMTNVSIIFLNFHVPVFCNKSCSVDSTWKCSEEAVMYISLDVK